MDRHKTKEEQQLGPPTAIQGNSNLLFVNFFSISGHLIMVLSIGIAFCRLGIFLATFEDLNWSQFLPTFRDLKLFISLNLAYWVFTKLIWHILYLVPPLFDSRILLHFWILDLVTSYWICNNPRFREFFYPVHYVNLQLFWRYFELSEILNSLISSMCVSMYELSCPDELILYITQPIEYITLDMHPSNAPLSEW